MPAPTPSCRRRSVPTASRCRGVPGTECASRRKPRRRPRRRRPTPFKAAPAGGRRRWRRIRPNSPPKPTWRTTSSRTRCRSPRSKLELKPKVLETFDTVANEYKRLRKLQEQDIELRLKNESLSPSQERKYKKLKDEIITAVKSLRLNQARIDSLVDQLYEINKRLVGLEGRMMRLAESHGVAREDFLKNYFGSELDPRWLNRVSKLSAKGWKNLVAKRQGPAEGSARQHPRAGVRDRARDRRIPQDRAFGAEGRARGAPGQEGNGRGEPAPRHLDRQEIHQSRPAIPRSHSGRQYRPDEGGRQVRIPPRLQVLDLRDMVDPAGDHAFDRRPGAHHPHSGAHDRDHQQDRAHVAARC